MRRRTVSWPTHVAGQRGLGRRRRERSLHREPAARDEGPGGEDRGRVQARPPQRAEENERRANSLGKHLAGGRFLVLPPKELREISVAEKEKQFDAELALWEKVQDSKEPAPLEDYLRRNPSGLFSELAQLALDRVLARQGEKRIVVVSVKENPYSQGSAMADLRYKLGDTYSYRELDLKTKAEKRTFSMTITAVRENEVVFDTG